MFVLVCSHALTHTCLILVHTCERFRKHTRARAHTCLRACTHDIQNACAGQQQPMRACISASTRVKTSKVHASSNPGDQLGRLLCCFAGERVYLALLLPLTGAWDGGCRIAGAAALAIDRVNADSRLLPDRSLEYNWEDSGCSAQQGLKSIGKLLAGESRISAVLGPGCSSACEVTSYLSGGKGIPQISYGCSSPSLSNKVDHQLVRSASRLRI